MEEGSLTRDSYVLGAYVALLVLGLFVHEPWADEAQLWVPARDASLGELLDMAPHEGHPLLQPLLLMPLAKAGLPMMAGRVLNLLTAALAAALLLFKSPFKTWQAAILIAGIPFVEAGWLMRPYALVTLLFMIVAWIHPSRHRRPLLYCLVLALLANTNLIAAFCAFGLGLVWCIEALRTERRPWHSLAVLLLLAGGAAFVLQLTPTGGQRYAFEAKWLPAMGYTVIALIAGLLAVREPSLRAAMLLAFFGYVFVDRWVYGLKYRHAGVIAALVIALMWISLREPGRPRRLRAALALMALLALQSAKLVATDVTGTFAPGKEMAGHVRALPPDAVIVAWGMHHAVAVAPYLDEHRLWAPETGEFETYTLRDPVTRRARRSMRARDVARIARERFGGRAFVLTHRPIGVPEAYGYRLRHHVLGMKGNLFLYEPNR